MNEFDQTALVERAVDIAERYLVERQVAGASGMTARRSKTDIANKLSSQLPLAKKIADQPSIRSRICASLQAASANVKEIAKLIVASALPLIHTGVLQITLTPMLVAAAAILILDSGLAAYCKEK